MSLIKGRKTEREAATEVAGSKSPLIKKDKISFSSGGNLSELLEEEAETEKEEEAEAEASNIVVIPTVEVKKETRPPETEEELFSQPEVEIDTTELIEAAERQAAEIIQNAQREAKKLIEESKLYCQSAMSQAEREGFVQGKEMGIEAGKKEAAEMIGAAKDLMDQIIKERELILKNAEPEIAQLAIKIAEKIISAEVSTKPEVVKSMVKAVVEKIRDREQVTIRVSPADADAVRNNREVYAKLVDGLKHLEIVSDPKVERGGCIIETNLGNVDGRISTQLSSLELAFKEVDFIEPADDTEEN